jgi:hypothetical protein
VPSPIPKSPATRQRTNKPPVKPAELVARRKVKVPNLPRREDGSEWSKLTRSFWHELQRSPMVAEYLPSDLHGLYICADLYEQYWRTGDVKYAAELQRQRQCYGLTPIDRRRLQWEVQKVEKGERGNQPAAESRTRAQGDARAVLHAAA